MQYYLDHAADIELLYKGAVAIWIWAGEDGDSRHIPPITKLYRIIDWMGDDEYEMLVIPFLSIDDPIIIGIPIAEYIKGELVANPGHPILPRQASYYFCNKCDRDVLGGLLCEVCDYDLCKNCAQKYPHSHPHPMFEFIRYYGIMTYQKDRIVEIFDIPSREVKIET